MKERIEHLDYDKWVRCLYFSYQYNNGYMYYPSKHPTYCFLYLRLSKCLYEIKEEGGLKQVIKVCKTLKEAKETVANIIKDWNDKLEIKS